ncbi:probable leucine-rich repeat receptor-like protein kinase At1g68400 [Andrographis paniculata]|uniref:probable leucine-rich repeat receptor-like protein kinase At1g68400 n=1 Tax=Andrographis paniculata TaxID=175694 RepID=UPI0021E8581E|nr:probable leucine-rich repeat receptor-like protein kinase At1g68400 [Andrographis paniculata]
MAKLSNGNGVPNPVPGWNISSYPCQGRWKGITCDNQHRRVKEISLGGFNFSGVLDARFLCNDRSLSASLLVVNISGNIIRVENLEDIANCSLLSHLLIERNQISGIVPESISQLTNLKVLDISHNQFSGALPDQLPGDLTVFRAQSNRLSGPIPYSDFSTLAEFNVSSNNLSGLIPAGANRFKMSSFIHNPGLCGAPLLGNCTWMVVSKYSDPAPVKTGSNGGVSRNQILMFAGYALIGLAVVLVALFCFCKRIPRKEESSEVDNKVAAVDDSSFSTVELKAGDASKTDFSAESGPASVSLTVLVSPEENGLRFEDLLKAPAELLGRGNHGSVYKVVCNGVVLAVKRIKDWPISSGDFRQRMRRLSQVKHRDVLPAIAFYSSREEKLLVYEYQDNGSLFRHIHSHDDPTKPPFGWSSRISAAATVANALAFMHDELHSDNIPHGNLKSSNILLDAKMEPRISEYGLMLAENCDANAIFKADTYAFGVILLELLTGRTVLNEGLDLASWVLAVVREEWTVEVFDRSLLREGVSEERMVNALQVAIKCVDKRPEARPDMKEVAAAIAAIRDNDEDEYDLSVDVVSELSITSSFVAEAKATGKFYI